MKEPGLRYLVIGAAGHAQEVAWSLREQAKARGEACRLDFFDDVVAPGPLASGLGGVVGRVDEARAIAERGEGSLVLGIGLPRMKAAVVARLACPDELWTTVIHPAAIAGPNVSIGTGSYVGPGAVLTVGVRIGRFTTVNIHCLAAHGDSFGDFVTLHPDAHVSGEVTIEEGCELGAGSVVIPGVRIGAWSVLGAGCVAVRDLPGGRTWVGVPARDLRGDDELEAVLVPSLEAR
jgi:acetyltransferase EpsM